MELTVPDLVHKREFRASSGNESRFRLDIMQDVDEVPVQLIDRIDITGVERQSDHGFDGRQIHVDASVIIGNIRRIKLFIILRPSMRSQILFRIPVGLPDRRQAGGLCRHDIDPVAVVRRHCRDAGAHKFHDLVLDVTVFENCSDDRQGDILGAYTGSRLSVQIDRDNTGIGDIIGVLEKLLAELAAALSDGHSAQSAIARMRIRAQDHLSAACHGFPHVLVDNGDVGRHIDPAVLFGGGQAKHVVILIDRAADRAQRVVAVGQNIREGEFLHS